MPGSREMQLNGMAGTIGWKANTTVSTLQNFSIQYLGDGTNPTLNLMTFKPNGGININGFLAPDVDLAIKDHTITDPFTPETKVHIKTWGPRDTEPGGGVYGLIVENTGWRGHDFAFQVKSDLGAVFSVANHGHVLIGQMDQGEINAVLPDMELYSLYVARGIRTERVRVDVAAENGWADYVFEEGYNLMSLEETEAFIKENGHLPGVPSVGQVVEEGIDLAEMNKLLLEKIKELTLRLIEMEKLVKNEG